MSDLAGPPIACALSPGEYQKRVDWITALTCESLVRYERRDLVLDLRYAPHAIDRVRELRRREQVCCPFLMFDLHEGDGEVQLVVEAPEDARAAADVLFEAFVAGAKGNPR